MKGKVRCRLCGCWVQNWREHLENLAADLDVQAKVSKSQNNVPASKQLRPHAIRNLAGNHEESRGMPEKISLQPADIFFTRGTGLLSRAIRLFTRVIGESRIKVNHVGIVVTEGDLRTAVVVETLKMVRKHKLWDRYGPPSRDEVAIYRATDLSPADIKIITEAAQGYEGRKYGYLKVLAHLGDWILQGAYVFRRLARMDNYPICSWLVAHSFKKAGKYFGVDPGAASPDDIWDFVSERPDIYKTIYPLGLLEDENLGHCKDG